MKAEREKNILKSWIWQTMQRRVSECSEGKEQTVKMQVDNRLAGVIIDRFGKDVMMIPTDEEHFTVKVDVHVSRQFLGWIFSLGEGIKIVGPEEVVNQMKAECERLMGQYQLPQ